MRVIAFRSRFFFETVPYGVFIRLPFIGQAFIERHPDNAPIPLSAERSEGRFEGYWGKLRLTAEAWRALKTTGEI